MLELAPRALQLIFQHFKAGKQAMSSSSSSSGLLTPDEEAMALLQSGPLSPAGSTSIHVQPPAAADDDCSSSTSSTDDDKHQHQLLHLRVKYNGGSLQPPPPSTPGSGSSGEYPLGMSPSATVSDLKASVRTVLGPGCRGRYLRLIVRGRLLAPDSAPVTNFGLEDDDVVHAVVAAAGVRGGHQARLAGGVDLSGIGGGGSSSGNGSGSGSGRRGRATSSARGIAIDAAGIIINNNNNSNGNNDDSDSDVDGDDDDDLEAGRQRRGFDRLRATGLNRDEIAILRLHFARQIDRFGERRERNRRRLERELQAAAEAAAEGGDAPSPPVPVPVPPQTSQDVRTDRLRLEEEWMAAQGPTSEFRLNLNANAPIVLSALRNRATLGGGFAESLVGATTGVPGGGAGGRGGAPRSASIVGTDRDFLWGFLLGFFLGNILFFWALVPSVPHKQRLGLIAGMCFHSMMRNKSDDVLDDDSYDD